jgi:hypothetical protein
MGSIGDLLIDAFAHALYQTRFFPLAFAFFSTGSFHAVRSAPASPSSLAAPKPMCVFPIFFPAGRNRQENPGCIFDKHPLLLQGEHQISVAFCTRCERSEFSASYAKGRQSCVRVLFNALQAQRNPPDLLRSSGQHPKVRVSHHHRTARFACSKVSALQELQLWSVDNLQKKLSVADLAGRVAMSRRNFERVFTRDRDYAITVRPTPLHWGLPPYARHPLPRLS